jgi:hypothetical protein
VGRRLAASAALGTLAFGSWFAACALDESGLQLTSDGSITDGPLADQIVVKDANPEANPPVLTCQEAGTPIDASCLGKPVPLGWQPIAVKGGAASCGDASFTNIPLLTSPSASGACNCTPCGNTGTNWTCGASIKGGNTCTTDTLDASASTCFQSVNHSTYGVYLTRSGNPQCGGGVQVGSRDASATLLTTCTPQTCDTDFCAMGSQGFTLCVYNANESDGGCPLDFPAGRLVGPTATVTCDNCQQCGLANATAQCTGSATAFSNNNCTGTNEGTATAGTCGDLGTGQYNSIYYDAGPVPVPNCGPTQGVNTGSVALDQPSTICCIQ